MTIVKILRTIYGDTQDELASVVGCVPTTLNKKENGKAKFTVKEMEKISEKYGVSLQTLIKEDQTRKEIIKVLQR